MLFLGHLATQLTEQRPFPTLSVTLHERNDLCGGGRVSQQQFKCCSPEVTGLSSAHISLTRRNHMGKYKGNRNCDLTVYPENGILKIFGKDQKVYCTPKAHVLRTNSIYPHLRNEMLSSEVYLAMFFHNHE